MSGPAAMRVHSESACSSNFQGLAANLDAMLMSNPPNYAAALDVLTQCIERRYVVGTQFYNGLDQAHQAAVNLVNNLTDTVHNLEGSRERIRVNFVGQPMRFMLYNANGNEIEVSATGSRLLRGGRGRRSTHKQRKSRKVRKSNRKTTRKN